MTNLTLGDYANTIRTNLTGTVIKNQMIIIKTGDPAPVKPVTPPILDNMNKISNSISILEVKVKSNLTNIHTMSKPIGIKNQLVNVLNVKSGYTVDKTNTAISTSTIFVKNANPIVRTKSPTMLNIVNSPLNYIYVKTSVDTITKNLNRIGRDVSRIKVTNNSKDTIIIKNGMSTITSVINSGDIVIDSAKLAVNGLDSMSLILVSGRACSVGLREFDSKIGIQSVSPVPSSIYYDNNDSKLKGIPLVLGNYLINITLTTGLVVKLLVSVVPEDATKVF